MNAVDTQARLAQPGAIDEVCAAITAGSTLVAWCREQALLTSLVAAWIELDDTRRKRYRDALEVRERHHKDEIIEQLRAMITSDITQAFNDDGTLKPLSEIPVGVRHWIAGMEIEEMFEGRGENRTQVGILRKIKLHDKVRSIELLMRNLKMLVEKLEVDGKLSIADLIAAGAKPRDAA